MHAFVKVLEVFLQGTSTEIIGLPKSTLLGSISLWDMVYFIAHFYCTLKLGWVGYDLLLQIEVKTLSRRNDSIELDETGEDETVVDETGVDELGIHHNSLEE